MCVRSSNWIRPVVACLPAWFRFAQCLRRYRDTREAFPHLVNAGKYSTTFFVVIFSTLNAAFSASSSAAAAAAALASTMDAPPSSSTGDVSSASAAAAAAATADSVDNGKVYSPFFYIWILCSIGSSLYAYTWDIKMDWGLLDHNAAGSENRKGECTIVGRVAIHRTHTDTHTHTHTHTHTAFFLC